MSGASPGKPAKMDRLETWEGGGVRAVARKWTPVAGRTLPALTRDRSQESSGGPDTARGGQRAR